MSEPSHRFPRTSHRIPPLTKPKLIGLLTALFLVVTAVAASPAQAYSQAFFHTVERGNKGVDVQAVQYLLQQAGISIAADGDFGSGTHAAVVQFQQARGLAADGIVGANTWAALAVTIREGSTGPAVRALQVQLNKKRRLGLTVDGVFGSGTASAVRSFQTHAGIGSDGVVGPTTWKNLIWHYAYPSMSGLCDKDPDGNGTANWGTGNTIGQLESAAQSFAGTGNGPIPLGDVSFEHGGDIPGHASHERGVDVDIWPIRTGSDQCTAGRITWQSAAYDRAATRILVQRIRAAAPGEIVLIYFNDPTLIGEGLTQQYPNHDNHLHIRYES